MLNLAQEIDKIFEEKFKNLETESGDGQNKQVRAMSFNLYLPSFESVSSVLEELLANTC
jgi:hypothetical protein